MKFAGPGYSASHRLGAPAPTAAHHRLNSAAVVHAPTTLLAFILSGFQFQDRDRGPLFAFDCSTTQQAESLLFFIDLSSDSTT
ncbi:hypothetical protein L1887_39461 [Cichorium endivia]|nr:hypothetical protein L1887_39461 [Cichorium endivia]